MPANKPYPGEDPIAAAKRISKNKMRKNNPDAVKTKADLMANVMPSVKNMGY